MTSPDDLVLELDHESAGVLAGALLSGDSCAVPVRHKQSGRLLLNARSDRDGASLSLRLRGGT
ncbi:hypothetical protein [Umezawaea sp. Da 62-37]|uniref:hypothetical protein n=1 Tax=Umezawaea sp. Da 62-37 TaxID=3075927 RepID=UPI0028F6D10F|nr:hypothetical protein [Umezawaea sp. Da 62-37]WNV82082.1 hypothetical protein RM788_28140 [Umezawaea sp. Da 62-37]